MLGTLVVTHGRKHKKKRMEEYKPAVTVFIPTFNEEGYIEGKLQNLLAQTYPVQEILIYDCSSDSTASIVEKYQKDYPRIKLIRQTERIGAARTFNQALLDARGEIVIKTDADVVLKSSDAIKDLVSNFSNPELGGASAVYVKEKGFEKWYRKFMKLIQVAESNIDSTLIAHTGLLAFRKSAVSLVDPNSMAEDTEEFILLRKKGFKTILDGSVEVEEEVPPNFTLRRRQRDRRAQGIIKAMLKNRDIFFNPKFKKYGFFVFPMEFFIISLSPLNLLAMGGVLAYILYLINPYFLILLCLPLALMFFRSNILFAVMDTQISGLIATLKFLLHKDQPLWSKSR